MRVGLVEFGERHDTRTNGQQYDRSQQTCGRPIRFTRAWQAELGSCPTRPTSLYHPREDVARVGHVSEDVPRMLYEATAAVEFQLNARGTRL